MDIRRRVTELERSHLGGNGNEAAALRSEVLSQLDRIAAASDASPVEGTDEQLTTVTRLLNMHIQAVRR